MRRLHDVPVRFGRGGHERSFDEIETRTICDSCLEGRKEVSQ